MSQGLAANRANLDAVESMYLRWRQDPLAVDESWRYFFEGFELGYARPAPSEGDGKYHTAFARLTYRYRELGHFLARIDPLNDPPATHPLLDIADVGLTEADLDRVVEINDFFVGLQKATLRQLIAALRETYCRTIGVEYMYIQDLRVRRWLQERMEPHRNRPRFERTQKIRILQNLHFAELFERFLHTRFTGKPSRWRSTTRDADSRRPSNHWLGKRVRDDHRHGPSRPAQRAGEHHSEALRRDIRPV